MTDDTLRAAVEAVLDVIAAGPSAAGMDSAEPVEYARRTFMAALRPYFARGDAVTTPGDLAELINPVPATPLCKVPVYVAVGWVTSLSTGADTKPTLAVAVDDTHEGALSRCSGDTGVVTYEGVIDVPYPPAPWAQE